jgi:hypothetical protein
MLTSLRRKWKKERKGIVFAAFDYRTLDQETALKHRGC